MKALLLLLAGITVETIAFAQPMIDSVKFMPPDTVVAWVVPPGNDSITVVAQGGAGGLYTSASTNTVYGQAGLGAGREARIAVSAGDTLFFFVGGTGYTGTAVGRGAFNGGGQNSANNFGTAGGGGGASDIRKGGRGLANRIYVAGGGGGASYDESNPSNNSFGGPAGHGVGGYGIPVGNGGSGASANAGGAGGTKPGYNSGTAGTLGQGGNGGPGSGGGGGGGGYYGGGGGSWGGGGGGSSWGDGIVAGPGVRHVRFIGPRISPSGYISITYIKNAAVVSAVSGFFIEIAVLPNPSKGAAKLILNLRHQSSVRIQLSDVNGRVVWQHTARLSSGSTSLALPSEELSAGMYFIRLIANEHGESQSLKWLKE